MRTSSGPEPGSSRPRGSASCGARGKKKRAFRADKWIYVNPDTEAVNWVVGPERARIYLEEVAALIGGKIRGQGSASYVVSVNSKAAPIDVLLPQHSDAWASAMQRFIERLRSDLASGVVAD